MTTVGREASSGASPADCSAVPAGQTSEERGRKLPCRRDPVPLADAVTDLLERSDLIDLHLRLRLAAWREGYAAGELAHAGDYEAGWTDAIAEVKHAQHELVGALKARQTRWVVRGQQRTRQTFADPHPDDYRPGAA